MDGGTRLWPPLLERAGGLWPRTRHRWMKSSWLGPGRNTNRRTIMHTPAAALAWELWRRHRARLMSIIGLILAFALVYPKLCGLAGFNPNSADALDEIARKFAVILKDTWPTPLRAVQAL